LLFSQFYHATIGAFVISEEAIASFYPSYKVKHIRFRERRLTASKGHNGLLPCQVHNVTVSSIHGLPLSHLFYFEKR